MKLGSMLIAKVKEVKIQKPKMGKQLSSKFTGPILKKAISNTSSIKNLAKSSSTSSSRAMSIIKKLSKGKGLLGLK